MKKNMILAPIAAVTLIAIVATIWVLQSSSADLFTEVDLFTAVRENNVHKVEDYIEVGRNPNVKNELGMTPLHFAAYYGFERCARALSAGGGNVGLADKQSNTPLHFAAGQAKASMTNLLLRAGADANARNAEGETPLHLAAANFARASAEVLLESGASVDAKDDEGRTALFNAVALGDKQLVEFLAHHGASLTEKDTKGEGLTDVADGNHSMIVLLRRLATQASPR